MNKTVFLLLTICSTLSMALPPGLRIEPGPVMKLPEAANSAIDALLLAKQNHLKIFMKSGNVTVSATQQHWQPGIITYNFVRQNCQTGGITGGMCIGGASLRVTVRQKQTGSMVKIESDSYISLIK